jgi:small conductance mechanosensitive channel
MPPTLPPDVTWNTALAAIGPRLVNGVLDAGLALALLAGGLWLSGRLAALVKRAARRSPRIDETLAVFFATIVHYGLMAFVVIAVLDRFGVETTQIVAVLGAATLAIGLALQGTLSNVAAGVMLVLFRPYRLGDFVEVAGRRGVVKEISLFTTELATPENVKLVLPNAQCWGAPIANFSGHTTRALIIDVAVPRSASTEQAIAALRTCVIGDERILAAPAAQVAVTALGEQTVTLQIIAWCATSDIIALKGALLHAAKHALDKAGVPAAYPAAVTYQYDMGAAPKV